VIDIVQFDHISMAVPNRDAQVEFLERVFGFRWLRSFDSDEGYRGASLAIPGHSGIAWEVLEPSGHDSYLHRFLAGPHGPGLHHLTAWVSSVRQAAEAMRVRDIVPWGYHEADGEDPEESSAVYIHPRNGGNGFLYQLLEGGAHGNTFAPYDDAGSNSLGIIAVNHLAHAGLDRDSMARWYEATFGFRSIYRSPGDGLESGFQTNVLETPTRQLRFEMISPVGDSSFVARFLERRGGPAMHHVTFEVGDWQRAVEACAYHQLPIFGERTGHTDGVEWKEAFIHPKDTGGILTQFFWQAEPGVWI
jgi:methylmalonyl-CoA/ethylmalonyl-CoA epimerase